MFVPIGIFLAIYYFLLIGSLTAILPDEEIIQVILILFPALAVMNLTIVHLVAARRFKALMPEPSLGIRLEKYFAVGSIRVKSLAASSVLMAVGLALTDHAYFTIYFSVLLLWLFFIWPTPKRVSKDLKLKGDEQKMVITKGEAFR
jgi:predicted lysophospholipase L1 biosynthesis ABC-type transport system permease subunit